MSIAQTHNARRPKSGRSGARWSVLPLSVLVFGAGCHLLPVHRIDPSIDPRRVGRANAPETANFAAVPHLPLAEQNVPLPPLPLQEMTDEEALQAQAPAASTPLLDAALRRAEEMESSLTQEPAVERASHVSVAESPTLPDPDHAAQRLAPDLLEEDPSPEIPRPLPDVPDALALAEPPRPAVRETPAPPPAKPAVPEPAPVPVEPADPWGEGLAALREFASRQASRDDEGAESWKLRKRLLDWLSREPSRAEPADASWSSVLSILAAATPDEGPADLRATARAIQEKAPLEIANMQLCRKVRGFGDYDALGSELRPKQSAVLYCELTGVGAEERDGLFHSRLDATISLRKRGSVDAIWTEALNRVDDKCRRRRLDFSVAYLFVLPETIEPGSYVLTVTEHDAVADREVSESIDLDVVKGP